MFNVKYKICNKDVYGLRILKKRVGFVLLWSLYDSGETKQVKTWCKNIITTTKTIYKLKTLGGILSRTQLPF